MLHYDANLVDALLDEMAQIVDRIAALNASIQVRECVPT